MLRLMTSMPMRSTMGAVPIRTKYSARVESLYAAATRPENRDPNVGTLDRGDDAVGFSSVGSAACGDMMRMYMKVGDDGKIEKVKYKAFGCAAAIASSAYAAEFLAGRTIEEAEALTNRDIARELALPPIKLHCSLLVEEAVQGAVKDWKAKKTRVQSAV